jgi:hypothetical protein
VTRISIASRSRLAAAEDMGKIIEGDSLFAASSPAFLCVPGDQSFHRRGR